MKAFGIVRDMVIFIIMITISAQSLTANSKAVELAEIKESQEIVEVEVPEVLYYEVETFDVLYNYGVDQVEERKKEVEVLSYQEEYSDELSSFGLKEEDLKFMDFDSTAYDLTETCCSKPRDHPEFGLTAAGYNLVGLDRDTARIVAVDPKVIPLHSKLYIKFESPYEDYTGVYTAGDTGSAIVGNIIDLFYGDFGTQYSVQETKEYGRRDVKVAILD